MPIEWDTTCGKVLLDGLHAGVIVRCVVKCYPAKLQIFKQFTVFK